MYSGDVLFLMVNDEIRRLQAIGLSLTEQSRIMVEFEFNIFYCWSSSMQCPHCSFTIQPQMEKRWRWNNKTRMNYDIYHQFCPGCHRLVIGVYEYSDAIPAPMEKEAMEKLILLKF